MTVFRAGIAYWLVLLASRIYPPLIGELVKSVVTKLANGAPE